MEPPRRKPRFWGRGSLAGVCTKSPHSVSRAKSEPSTTNGEAGVWDPRGALL